MNNFLKRLETLFMAVSFAEANSMKLFNLSVNETLVEDAFDHNRAREDKIDRSEKTIEMFGKEEIQQFHF